MATRTTISYVLESYSGMIWFTWFSNDKQAIRREDGVHYCESHLSEISIMMVNIAFFLLVSLLDVPNRHLLTLLKSQS
jgi:hypothetical protein